MTPPREPHETTDPRVDRHAGPEQGSPTNPVKCPACFAEKPCPSHVCEHPDRRPLGEPPTPSGQTAQCSATYWRPMLSASMNCQLREGHAGDHVDADGLWKRVDYATPPTAQPMGQPSPEVAELREEVERLRKENTMLGGAWNVKEAERRRHRDALQEWADAYNEVRHTLVAGRLAREDLLWERCMELGLRVLLIPGQPTEQPKTSAWTEEERRERAEQRERDNADAYEFKLGRPPEQPKPTLQSLAEIAPVLEMIRTGIDAVVTRLALLEGENSELRAKRDALQTAHDQAVAWVDELKAGLR